MSKTKPLTAAQAAKLAPVATSVCAVALGADAGHAAYAVALGGIAHPIVIETFSAAVDGTPPRQPSKRVQLVPYGTFAARDGRPFGMVIDVVGADGKPAKRTLTITHWSLNNEQGWKLADRLNERHNPNYNSGPKKNKASFGFDYEHQSLKAATNGQPAPRSGSGSQFEWSYGEGLFITDVKWTPRAAKAILDEEYPYISPILIFDPDTGVVLDVFNAALAHTPALQELAGLQVTHADLKAHVTSRSDQHNLEDSNVTLLEQLIARLGLPTGTTEAAALSAVDAMKNTQAAATALGAALQLPADVLQDAGKATAAAVALNAKVQAAGTGAADASAQAIAALSSEVAALRSAQTERDVNALIDAAKAQGKLVPAMEAWAKGLGVAQLSAFLASAPVIAPTQSTAQGLQAQNPPQGAAALGADAGLIAAQLGLSVADLAAA